MPVKVRCPECQKVLQAPDAARGKAIKCPECAARVPVPAGDAAESPAKPKKPAAKAPPAAPPKKKVQDAEDFLLKADLDRSVDHDTKVCPKCGADLDEEDEECGVCGIDLRTGTLGKTARKARMKGPDPADYYKLIWGDAWNFLKENFNVAMLSFVSMLTNLVVIWLGGLAALGGATNDHMPSYWAFFTLQMLFLIGIGGWYAYLAVKVTSFSLEKKIKLDRTPFEMFSGIATGISWLVWTVVALVPAVIILGPLYLVLQDSDPPVLYGVLGTVGAIWVLPLIPVAMAHRSMPEQWKVWVSPVLWKFAAINLGPILYSGIVIFVAFLPALLVEAGGVFLGTQFLLPTLTQFGLKYQEWNQFAWLTFAVGHFIPTGALSSSQSVSQVTVVVILIGFLLIKVLALFLYTCGAMVMVRVLGQFTYFHKKYLGLITDSREVKYVAKKIEYGPDGEPIDAKTNPIVVWVGSTLGTVVLYGVVNIILYFTTDGKYVFLPRWLRTLLKLTNGME